MHLSMVVLVFIILLIGCKNESVSSSDITSCPEAKVTLEPTVTTKPIVEPEPTVTPEVKQPLEELINTNGGREEETEKKDEIIKNEEEIITEREDTEKSYVQKNDEISFVEGKAIVNGNLVGRLVFVEDNLITNVSITEDTEVMNSNLWGRSLYGNGYLTLSYHYIKNEQIYKLNDFYKKIKMFDIASSGDAIAYYTENDTITLLNTQDETVEEIPCVRGNLDYGVVVSPDGRTVAYSNGQSIYVYRDGVFEEVYTHYAGGYIAVISITDNGEDVFYFNFDTNSSYKELWCKNKGKEARKIVEIEDCRALITNSNKTQLGVYDMSVSGRTLSIYDTESEKVSRINLNNINCLRGVTLWQDIPMEGDLETGKSLLQKQR